MEEFKEGDLVRLKSGGPTMTVKTKGGFEDDLICQWFSGSKLQNGYFIPSSLIKAEETDE